MKNKNNDYNQFDINNDKKNKLLDVFKINVFLNTLNIEDKAHFMIILRGFVFIFMFLLSLLAMYLIFKTPYYNYYLKNEPVVIEGNAITLDNMNNPQNDDNVLNQTSNNKGMIVDNEQEQTEDEDEQGRDNLPVADPSVTMSKNYSNLLVDRFGKDQTSKDNLNKKAQKEEKRNKELLANKDNGVASLIKDNAMTYNNQQSSADNPAQKDLQNKPTKQSPSPKTTTSNDDNEEFQGDLFIENKTEQDTSQDDSNDNKSSAKKPTIDASPANVKLSNNQVFLVNIFSSKNKEILPSVLKKLKMKNFDIFNNADAYFTEYMSASAGKTYRISIARKTSGIKYSSFSTRQQASKYCQYLKKQGIDCFVSPLIEKSLPVYFQP